MESQQEQEYYPPEIYGCDESKCVSNGRSDLYGGSFTCYGEYYGGDIFPMKCADGYLPMIVDDEPEILASSSVGDIPLSYFTCCPPYSSFHNTSDDDWTRETIYNITRHCSDPITTTSSDETINVDALCENENQDNRKYPRQMKPSKVQNPWFSTAGVKDSFLCCDTNTATADFLEESECVNYRNNFYESSEGWSRVGLLFPAWCDFPEGDFIFPHPVSLGTIGQYQCCRNEPAFWTVVPTFVQNSAFKITVYLPFALWIITAIVSLVTAVGLTVPLLIQLRNGIFKKEPKQKAGGEIRYSTFNLYVVYLALLNLIYAFVMIGFYGSAINQNFTPSIHGPFIIPSAIASGFYGSDTSMSLAYALGNLLINAVISYQVLVLLQSLHQEKRLSQPGLKRVNLQIGAVYFAVIACGLIYYFLWASSQEAANDGDFGKVKALNITISTIVPLFIFPPIGYVCNVDVLIRRNGYIPSLNGATTKQKAMRNLLFYFYRIIGLFLVIWVPSVVLHFYAVFLGNNWALLLSLCLLAIQPILSFCLVLTKPDARKYIWDLVTMSYLFGDDDASVDANAAGTNINGEDENVSHGKVDDDAGTCDDANYDDTDSLIFSVLGLKAASDGGSDGGMEVNAGDDAVAPTGQDLADPETGGSVGDDNASTNREQNEKPDLQSNPSSDGAEEIDTVNDAVASTGGNNPNQLKVGSVVYDSRRIRDQPVRRVSHTGLVAGSNGAEFMFCKM